MLSASKLGRDSRLITAENFQRVFKNAKRIKHLGISLLVCKNDLHFSRLGVVIPKRQIPRSVDRNRIRRIIKETFRLRRKELANHFDMVFLVYSTLLDFSNDEIRACLDFLWAKLVGFCSKA